MAKPTLFDSVPVRNQVWYRQQLKDDPDGVFWSKVDKRSANECWNWQHAMISGGYGQARHIRFSTNLAHRIAYELMIGPIPNGLHLDHLCRNRRCVNPAHLEPVTARENLLRGIGWAAKNARKTHCPKGHEYTPENTKTTCAGGRSCKACAAKSRRERGLSRKSRDRMNEARRKKRRENPQKYREQDRKRWSTRKGKT